MSIISVFPMAKNHQKAWLYQAINWDYKIEHNTDLGVMSLISDAQYWTCFKIFLTKFFNQFLTIGHHFSIIYALQSPCDFSSPLFPILFSIWWSRNWNATKLDLGFYNSLSVDVGQGLDKIVVVMGVKFLSTE